MKNIDKYTIISKIGQGGMSVVYLALDKRLNKPCAIKEIRKTNTVEDSIKLSILRKEADLLKNLEHVVLPRIWDIIDNNTSLFIVMDYVEGKTLSTILEQYGIPPEELVVEWAKQLCSALSYLHSQTPPILYLDMKPSNIILKEDGNIKLIDFGIAKEYSRQTDNVALGTLGYAAPEQFLGEEEPRTDIYGLGVTLHHLLTGEHPSQTSCPLAPIRTYNSELSKGLEYIISKCTEPDLQKRYTSCKDLLYDLENYNSKIFYCKKHGFLSFEKILHFLFDKLRNITHKLSRKQEDTNDISSTEYLARLICDLQKNETNNLNQKGPNYNE